MGFRCTLVSEDFSGNKLPKWFRKKYENCHNFETKSWLFGGRNSSLVSSKRERKYYSNEFFEDYQQALIESGLLEDYEYPVSVVVLGEDGFVTKVKIWKDEIRYILMQEKEEHHQIPSWFNGPKTKRSDLC